MSGRGRHRRRVRGQGAGGALLPGPGHIEPPPGLGPDALDVWCELAPEVARFGLIHGAGAGLLAEYCRLSVEWAEVYKQVRGEGMTVAGPRGMKANPRFAVLLSLNSRLLRLEDRLGMSPLARARRGLR